MTESKRRWRRRAAALLAVPALAAAPVSVAGAHAKTTYVVNTTADHSDDGCDRTSGDCTLREAIDVAKSRDAIAFDIGAGGPVTILLDAALPDITQSITIDGRTQPGYSGAPIVTVRPGPGAGAPTVGLTLTGDGSIVKGLIIFGFSDVGILVSGNGNDVGEANAGNIIASNGVGIEIDGTDEGDSNNVTGNWIDTNSSGADSANGNAILGNSIYGNARLGIDLGDDGVTPNDPDDSDTGANNLQNFPVLTGADFDADTETTMVSGTVNSAAYANYRVEIFASPRCDPTGNGEGRYFLLDLTVNTEGSRSGTFAHTVTAFPGNYITATATDQSTGDTSEFSQCRQVPSEGPTGPDPPTAVSAGAGNGFADVSWLAPANDGGSAITSYTVTPSAGTPVAVAGNMLTATVPLTNGNTYTFTVTASNGVGDSVPSLPSGAVTPMAGAPPPDSESQDLGSTSGTVSTGTTGQIPTPGDPTVTTVFSPNGGVVTIGETTMTGNPPIGSSYFGQLVNIGTPPANASSPLRFTITTDCSLLPPSLQNCPTPSGPAAAAAAQSVSVTDYTYTPRNVTVDQGGSVTWHFGGPNRHSVTDSRGLGAGGGPLYDSGSQPAGATFSRRFPAAGEYSYRSRVTGDPTSMNGFVRVPATASAALASGQDPVAIRWATQRPVGFRFDVQYRFHGPGRTTFGPWTSWRQNTTATNGQLVARNLRGDGTYQFRARLENGSTTRTTGWSPAVTVTIRSHIDSIATFFGKGATNTQIPDCTGSYGTAQPTPVCSWSEQIIASGDLKVILFSTGDPKIRNVNL